MMKKLFFYLWAVVLGAAGSEAKLNVVASLPDFGAIAREIGGDKIKVTTIARGTEDPHFVDARPSFIRALNQADLLIEGGAELEAGWLPRLVNGARNGRILGDAPGHLALARYLELIEAPAGPVDRSMGDIHPLGNPHFWLDPMNGKIIAAKIAERLQALDGPNAGVYAARLRAFEAKIDQKLPEWQKRLEPFRGAKVITYHKSFEYFTRRFGLEVFGQLEPKPGIEPTAVHLNSLVQRAKNDSVKMVWIEPFRPRKNAEQVARAIGASLLVLANMVDGAPEVTDYVSEFENLTGKIAAALAGSK